MNMAISEPDQLTKQVIEVIRENVEEGSVINLDSDLSNSQGIDSLSVIMIVDGIEERFNILVQEPDIEAMTTVDSIVTLLRDKYGVSIS
ncbi:MAG: acyl carrier protein [Desulfobulbaceae bacterium]|nr:acyl carrier protein [Desulfobulbaceae bacterium]